MTKRLTRMLRHNQTDAEIKLWYLLRNRHLHDYKFRRQYPIGPYIADFCCVDKRLIVELDGGQHAETKEVVRDRRRTKYLMGRGYKVLRFWDNEALKDGEAVLENILSELGYRESAKPHLSPHPSLSHRERERNGSSTVNPECG